MKVNTIAKLAWCLDHQQHELTMPEDMRKRAEAALRRMLDLSAGGGEKRTPEEEQLEQTTIGARGCGCA
jgi:hypothetical protein